MPGIAITLHGVLMLIVVPPLMYRCLLANIGAEEAALVKQFGDEYRAYKNRVGRFFPTFR